MMLQVPAVTVVRTPLDVMLQTPLVDDVKTGARLEDAVAVRVGDVPKFWVPGFANVIVWLASSVNWFEAADGEPVPAVLVAVTVKVYAWPLVTPVTMCDRLVEPALLSVPPAGLDIAM